ncbi:MAG: hypothetical protein OEY37_02325 [Gammaproteobacteria bacterium]|nr:hypothetical protein [Gammaproteobacteria bacterium]MDH5620317.1 hypothetical protein [Gammaproteobacteria bacterium]
MTDHLDRFHAALTVLAGHGHIKQRLIKAYEDNLVEIHDDELPIAMRQSFADLRVDMHRVSPLNGEGPICASVRKMSLNEASEIAGRIVSLYGQIARARDDLQSSLPLVDGEETRVPPFLVKSV